MRRFAPVMLTTATISGALLAGSVPGVAAGAAPVGPAQFAYGSDPRQVLDVYTPEDAKGRRPTVVLVHGGSWIKGDKAQMAEPARQFLKRGYVAVSVNYRYAPDAGWPGQREDVQQALRWITDDDRARRLHVDPDRLVVIGSSAGAEIAASAVTQGRGSRYARGLVTLSGPMDLRLAARDSAGLRATLTGLLGCAPSECRSQFKRASAIDQVSKRDPAALVIAAKKEWVDPRSSVRFHRAAREAGMRSKLVMLSGRAHGMNNWDAAWPKIRRWVNKQMNADR